MTVEINGYEIHCDVILYITPIENCWSPSDVKIEEARMVWQRFDIGFKGNENELYFTANYPSKSAHSFKTKEELESARQKIIEALNK